jgi:predicted secreted hydrolase
LVPRGEKGQKSEKERALVYWEGPVAASDESVMGYLEMTGYSEKVQL